MSARDVSLTGIPNIGKATVIGALVGAISVAVPVTLLLSFLGGGPMSILAGVQVGFFGGMGYGGMLGAVIRSDRFERALVDGRSSRADSVDQPGDAARRSSSIVHSDGSLSSRRPLNDGARSLPAAVS